MAHFSIIPFDMIGVVGYPDDYFIFPILFMGRLAKYTAIKYNIKYRL